MKKVNKTNLELAEEFVNIVNKEMKVSDIFEIKITSKLSLSRQINIQKLINEKLTNYGFGYNHKHLKNGNILIFKNKAINYVQKNFI